MRFADFVEGRFERLHKAVREFANKPYRVREQERQILENDLAHGGVQCCEEFVFHKHVGVAEQVHDGGFADVGVTHEGDADELLAVSALGLFLLVYFFQPLFQQ